MIQEGGLGSHGSRWMMLFCFCFFVYLACPAVLILHYPWFERIGKGQSIFGRLGCIYI